VSQLLRAPRTREQDFLQAREWPSLVELAKISEEEWDEVTRGSAVRRAGWEGLRRNARANLLNLRRRIGRESGEP
jgi:epoxyqueuosine reductase QueG